MTHEPPTYYKSHMDRWQQRGLARLIWDAIRAGLCRLGLARPRRKREC